MNVPEDLKFAETHEWIRVNGDIGTVGITDHAQAELTRHRLSPNAPKLALSFPQRIHPRLSNRSRQRATSTHRYPAKS